MPVSFRWILALLLVFGLERGIRTQTDGFSLQKTKRAFAAQEEWECPSTPPEGALDQPYTFLGSGVQSYAFGSADGKYVLKLFKHYHLFPKKDGQNFQRIDSIFRSCVLAKQELEETTGLLHVQLNPPRDSLPLVLYDKIGVRHCISLQDHPFILQKRAELLLPYIKKHPEEMDMLTRAFFDCIHKRSAKHIANTDIRIERNFGVLEGKVIEIDVGSFRKTPYMRTSAAQKQALYFQGLRFGKSLAKHMPGKREWFDHETRRYLTHHCGSNLN